jgi:membrane protease subunit HflK
MEEVLRNTPKVVMDQNGKGQGVLPYLPLPEIKRNQPAATGQGAAK